MIHINQIGYRPEDQKVAIFTGDSKAFEVYESRTQKVVYRGEWIGPTEDIHTGDRIFHGDFTKLQQPGEYYIKTGEDKSFAFRIQDNIYKDLKNSLLKAFYYQRCGVSLEEKYAGKWKHGACHVDESYLYEAPHTRMDTRGGWHDAGDYGKYTGPGANALGHLLYAFECFPCAFLEPLHIPESGNHIPDILNECRFELDWLLKMQDPDTGGVYHKVATPAFPGFIMPEEDKEPMAVSAVSATATGDFAAIMARASTIYKEYDKGFAQRMLEAAQKAWEWLVKNPYSPGFKNPPDIQSGEYGDHKDQDERFWAAVELYRATGVEGYHQYIQSTYWQDFDKLGLGWAEVGGFGTVGYLLMEKSKTDHLVRQHLKELLCKEAEQLVKRVKADGYKSVLTAEEYIWGSNMLVMNKAILLIIANMIEPKASYIEAAADQLHYLLGRNTLGQSYVTGFGSKTICYPHHRPSGADGITEPIPGLVSGGPNKGRQDEAMQSQISQDIPPAKAFIDDQGSYASNEITIYWNSPAVFVAAYFDR